MQARVSKWGPRVAGGVMAATIVASSLMLAAALRMQRETGAEVRRHFENVLTLRRTQQLLVDAETGQRGFLLTGEPVFLAPYDQARAGLPDEFARLVERGIVPADGPLETNARAKLRELALTIDLARSGRRAAALDIVGAGSGKAYMDRIRAEAGRLIAQERTLNEAAIDRAQRYAARTYLALALLFASGAGLVLLAFWLTLRMRRLQAEAIRLREVEVAERRTALIAKELNHRVKNLFSIVLAIIQLASRGTTSPKEAVGRILDRVLALARAHEVSLAADPLTSFDLETILRAILAPYAGGKPQLELSGPAVQLPPMRATPISLIIHELATNAVKYGAWATSSGRVHICWSVGDAPAEEERMFRLEWNETRDEPVPPDGVLGFGSKLIQAAVAQLEGTMSRTLGQHGISIVIDAPIVPAG